MFRKNAACWYNRGIMTVASTFIGRRTSGAVLHGVSWQTYEMLLRDIGEQHVYLTYDRGELEVMAPSDFHERYKKIVGRLIETMTLELNIPIASVGSATFRREDVERGLEPDECYYVQHELQIRDNWKIDLRKDPPPDLAIEMDYTHHALDRESVYAALGVPEVWRFDGARLEVLVLSVSGSYESASKSRAFPFLPMDEFERFVLLAASTPETTLVRQFHDWVKQNISTT
jgi:Uma2 family endonuclease